MNFMTLVQTQKLPFCHQLWKAKSNVNEFKARVKKIFPYIEISIGSKEQKEFEIELGFEREYYQKYEPRIELFEISERDL